MHGDLHRELLTVLEDRVAALAAEDVNVFCEYVMRDERGQPFKQEPIHRLWHAFIDLCEAHRSNPVILASWGSGKSSQIAIARVLWELGRNPSLRVKIVCNSDVNAKLRVASIGRYITDSVEYHRVFPHVVPDRSAFWSAHELFVKRRGRSVDPSVEAKGIMAVGIGGRADLIVFDDVVDLRNAIEQPALREKVKENFFNVWMSRLDVDGRAWYISTAWHEHDLTSQLRYDRSRRDQFWVMTQEVTDDLEHIRVVLDVPAAVEAEARERMRRVVGDLWADEFHVLHS